MQLKELHAQNPLFLHAHILLQYRSVAHDIHIGFAGTAQGEFIQTSCIGRPGEPESDMEIGNSITV